MTISLEEKIRTLALEHGINSSPNSLDQMAQAITKLAGDDVALDDVSMLIVNLSKAGHLSTQEALQWMALWQDEKRSV